MMLGVVLRLAFLELDVALDREFLREQLAEQQHDHAGVREVDAELGPAPGEAVDEGRGESGEKGEADEVAAGKNRDGEFSAEKLEEIGRAHV